MKKRVKNELKMKLDLQVFLFLLLLKDWELNP